MSETVTKEDPQENSAGSDTEATDSARSDALEPEGTRDSEIKKDSESAEQASEDSASDQKPSKASLPPRVHNVISYGVAAIWMAVAVPLDEAPARGMVILWILHFGRRTLEALFVHRYSGRPVSPADYISEYIYYWGFTNWIAYGLSSPDWEPARGVLWLVGMGLFFLGEFGNAWAHLRLRALRSGSGETTVGIPRGGMFELVSCPHYLFEIVTWVGFAILTQVWGAYGFLALGSIILLTSYAAPRHKKYIEHFDGKKGRPLYPKQRKAIIPFVF